MVGGGGGGLPRLVGGGGGGLPRLVGGGGGGLPRLVGGGGGGLPRLVGGGGGGLPSLVGGGEGLPRLVGGGELPSLAGEGPPAKHAMVWKMHQQEGRVSCMRTETGTCMLASKEAAIAGGTIARLTLRTLVAGNPAGVGSAEDGVVGGAAYHGAAEVCTNSGVRASATTAASLS